MTQLSISTSRLDRIAMGLSGLCLVHCVATAVLLGAAVAGRRVSRRTDHPRGRTDAGDDHRRVRARPRHPRAWLHAAERGRRAGPRRDGRRADACRTTGIEPIYTVLGVMILALGHRLNVDGGGMTSHCLPGGRARTIYSSPMASHDHQLHEGDSLKRGGARAADPPGRAVDRHARRGVRRAGGLRQAGQRL